MSGRARVGLTIVSRGARAAQLEGPVGAADGPVGAGPRQGEAGQARDGDGLAVVDLELGGGSIGRGRGEEGYRDAMRVGTDDHIQGEVKK